MSDTTTPKRCEAVAFASNRQLEALDACREDEHNGTVEVWMRPTDTHAQPLYPASALEALQGEVQRLREALETIAWKRSPGPMPNRIPGSVMQQIEVIALNALKDPTP